jgi:3-oxoacyl-[acyl-carrier protein] reductase
MIVFCLRPFPYYGEEQTVSPVEPITKRVAIVTGGSRGIGRATAERLAADGLGVVIAYARNDAEAKDETAVAALFDTAERKFGGVDVVVNAAGIMILGTIADFDLTALDRMHRTNIRGTFVVNQQAARRVRPGGAIVNFSTTVKKVGPPGYGPYAATKGAVDAISLILAKELQGRDITVNAVAPGPTATELFLDDKDEATIDQLSKMNPMGRLGTPADIAEVVSFLAGPGRWVNGQVLYVNGGMMGTAG